MGEVGDFKKFRTQSEIMKLAGLGLYEISSGKRKGDKSSPEDGLLCGNADNKEEWHHA
jgi:hypothetical protein